MTLTFLSRVVALAGVSALAIFSERMAFAQFQNDSFENPTLNSFWTIPFTGESGIVGLSTDQNHTPGGMQSLKFTSAAGNRDVELWQTSPSPVKGTFSIWFYDYAPGQQTFYEHFDLFNSQTAVQATIGTNDFQYSCYIAFVYFSNTNVLDGQNANCGVYQNPENTSVSRTLGWHLFTIKVDSAAISLAIDSNPVLNVSGDFAFDSVRLRFVAPYWRPDTVAYFDDFSFTATDTTPPLVSNVQVAPDPVAINTPSTLTATIDDSTTGGSNIASAQYNIDGGQFFPMQATDRDFNQVTENVTVSVPGFAATGVYNLCVTGTDSASNTSGPSCIPLPVYDPTGGFVTGGGSIFSPAGKDLVNTSAAGAATFGFVSKYLKGSNIPSGNLEFHFQAGNLHFQSTSMDWLVVTGEPRAKFHGVGTINGASVCQFAVDAWANSFPSTNGPVDAFGIKIYSCNSGGDFNGNRYSFDATPLSGGRIIVHQ